MAIGLALLTRPQLWYGALRQVLLGGVAAAVTYAVGTLIGVSAG